MLFVIVGLGNPGPEYAGTRHNIGFMVVDRLAAAHSIRIEKNAGSYLWGSGRILGAEVVLAKPLTFMNLSGKAVKGLLESLGVPAQKMLVVYDDSDLETGTIRLRRRGGSGGHRGIASVIEHIGTTEFPRLRMGIGRGDDLDLKDYVLSPFSQEEMALVNDEIERGVASIEAVVSRGIDYAMNRYNRRP